jgi:hypothetical protein
MKKITYLFGILLLFAAEGYAYTNRQYQGIPVMWRTLWEMQNMPHHFKDYNGREGNLTSLYGGQALNDYHRLYEPGSVILFGGMFETFRRLNERTRLYAAIDFRNTHHQNQYRSVEKDFYGSYISFSDTTKGNFQFNGPLIDFFYSQDFTDRLTMGLKINYGVEQGIKDVYTQARTRELNSDITVSARYNVFSSFFMDAWIRRYRVRSTFEAVKEFQDALVWTWIGYSVFRPENPGSSINTERNKNGYNLGSGLLHRKAESPFSMYVSFTRGTEENDARKGTRSDTSQRGFWQSSYYEGLTWIKYDYTTVAMTVFGQYCYNEDWGKTGLYNAVFMEYEESRIHGGVGLDLYFRESSSLSLSLRAGNFKYDYKDYLSREILSSDELSWRGSIDLSLRPYPVTAWLVGASVEKIPLHFTWKIPSMMRYQIYAGFEYQPGLNRFCPSLIYSLDVPEGSDKINNNWQIKLCVMR